MRGEIVTQRLREIEQKIDSLTESISKLQSDMTKMLKIFEEADKELHENHIKALKEPGEKIQLIINQNKLLAQGIIGLSDQIENMKGSYPLRRR